MVAAPVIRELTTKPSIEVIYGIDFQSYNSIPPALRFISGGPFAGPFDVIVDDVFAGTKRAKVGDSVEILNHQFRICGIVEHGKGARKFVQLTTLQDLIGAPGHASVFYVKLDDPANMAAVVQEIKAVPGMENYSVVSMQEYLSMMTPENLPGFETSIRIVVAISMIIGFLVIFQSMYTAVMERTREIGILKSLGATKLYIVNVVLRETASLAVVGIVAGNDHQPACPARHPVRAPHAPSFLEQRMGRPRHRDRPGRRFVRSLISRLQSCPERSHRRSGL